MQRPPSIAAITGWLRAKRPLGISDPITVTDIDPKPWSGHFNYLVTAPGQRFVLRFKGPEWGEPASGIVNEYENLKLLESYAVGPRVFGLEQDFFGEPAMFMEFLEGKPLSAYDSTEQMRFFPEVLRLIAAVNRIPHETLPLKLDEPYVSYERSWQAWQERLSVIRGASQLQEWAGRLEALLPRVETMLDRFEPRLERVLKAVGPSFIFASAHGGHCFPTGDGLRFINWEKTSSGDPSFTLAVFLASISARPDFETVKTRMVEEYTAEVPIPEFSALLEERLAEREVSNLFWVLWAYVNRRDTAPPDTATGAPARYERVLEILDRYAA